MFCMVFAMIDFLPPMQFRFASLRMSVSYGPDQYDRSALTSVEKQNLICNKEHSGTVKLFSKFLKRKSKSMRRAPARSRTLRRVEEQKKFRVFRVICHLRCFYNFRIFSCFCTSFGF